MLTAKSKLRNLKSKPGFFEQDESETCNFPFSDDLTIDTAIDRKNPRAYERDPKIRKLQRQIEKVPGSTLAIPSLQFITIASQETKPAHELSIREPTHHDEATRNQEQDRILKRKLETYELDTFSSDNIETDDYRFDIEYVRRKLEITKSRCDEIYKSIVNSILPLQSDI